jgi:hypothetical protein
MNGRVLASHLQQPAPEPRDIKLKQFADPLEGTGFPLIGLKPEPRKMLASRAMVSQVADGLAQHSDPETSFRRDRWALMDDGRV